MNSSMLLLGITLGFFCGLGAATAEMMYGLLVTLDLSSFQIFSH